MGPTGNANSRQLLSAVVSVGLGPPCHCCTPGSMFTSMNKRTPYARSAREFRCSPNASRVLHGFGLGDALAKVGVRPFAFHLRRWDDGHTLVKIPLGDAVITAFGFPHYQSHRADVLAMLMNVLPTERLHISHRLVALTDHGDRVEAAFQNGDRITVDILVGADGIHSTVRQLLFGPATPHFTGCIAYRGLVPTERIKHLNIEVNAQRWMGPGKHIITYYVAGKQLLNFVGTIEQELMELASHGLIAAM